MENKLIEGLAYCREKFGWTICIKDFFKLMIRTKGTSELLSCYLSHECAYCDYIKSNPVAFSHCVEEGENRLLAHILKIDHPEDGFFGTCYAGVREFVMPIFYRTKPIGALIIGATQCNAERKATTFTRLSEEFGFDPAKLKTIYADSLAKNVEEEMMIRHEALMSASYIQMLCERYLDPKAVEQAVDVDHFNYTRSAKLNHAILYIKQNLSEKITVDSVARACMCSASSISHLFKEEMGEGVNAYLLNERVSLAKRLILHSKLNFAEIADKCGFCTNKYMTGVFKKQLGMTPSEYKKQTQINKGEKQ